MLQITPKFPLNQHWVTVMSLVYLSLPCMLFFSSWYAPWVAWLVNLGIMLFIVLFARSEHSIPSWRANSASLCALAVAALVSILLFIVSGIAGYFSSAPDVLIFREALYNNLIHEAWPLVLPDGKEMSYYLAGMLPPALLARLTDDYTLQRMIAVCWYGLGIWLTLLLFYCRHRKFSILFLLFMVAFKDPVYLALNAFAGNGEIWGMFSRLTGCTWENSYMGVAHPVKMLSINAQGCNFQPFSLLCAALIINNREHAEKLIPLSIALILPSSPLGAIGCMPLALYAWCKYGTVSYAERALYLIVPVMVAFFCAVYYIRAESATCFGFYGQLLNNWSYFLFNYYIAILLSAVLFTIVLYPLLKIDTSLRISLICIVITPWIFYGSSPDSGMFGQNELWLKTSIIFHMHLIAALCFNWQSLPVVKYFYLVSFALLVCRDERVTETRFTGTAQVEDVWGGHLNHEHVSLYQKIPACKPPFIPGSLLKKGEAELVWPGIILPKAKGCDYSRPMKPDGRFILAQ